MKAVIATFLAVASLAACSTSVSPSASSPAPKPTTSTTQSQAPAAFQTLRPAGSATFTISQSGGGPKLTETWKMADHIVTVPDSNMAGFDDVAFDMTISNIGQTAVSGDLTFQSAIVSLGPDSRIDNTVASTAGSIVDGQYGLQGSNLGLQQRLLPGQIVAGYVDWLVPHGAQAVQLIDPNTNQPVLQVDVQA